MNEEYQNVDWSKWDSKENCFAKYEHIKSNLIYGSFPAKEPDVSVMIPTFRRADLLKEAIESVLNQKTNYHYTINVVDNDGEVDSATDRLMRGYCEKYPNILYFRNEQNIGMFGNLNRCIELSQTQWLCMLHDDDMLAGEYIEKMLSAARQNTYGVICCYKKIQDERTDPDLQMSETGKGGLVSFLIKLFLLARRGQVIPFKLKDARHAILTPGNILLINKKIAIEVGGFNAIYSPCADLAFVEKVTKYSGSAFLPCVLTYYRIAENVSLKGSTMWAVLICEPSILLAVLKSMGAPRNEYEQRFFEILIVAYNSFLDIKRVLDFDEVAKEFQLPRKYYNVWVRRWVMVKNYLSWGALLFRKSGKKA